MEYKCKFCNNILYQHYNNSFKCISCVIHNDHCWRGLSKYYIFNIGKYNECEELYFYKKNHYICFKQYPSDNISFIEIDIQNSIVTKIPFIPFEKIPSFLKNLILFI